MTLYARKLALRTCGRLSIVASDFGAQYRTHTHVTSEALYASLTRGVTWQPRSILIKDDTYDFARDYAINDMPIWFTPGLFRKDDGGNNLSAEDLDTNYFNAVQEYYPSTSTSYTFEDESPVVKTSRRPHHVPTYGTWESVLPNRRLLTYALSPDVSLLEKYVLSQTYMLGKKRTMVQIIDMSDIAQGYEERGTCQTPFLQLDPRGALHFASFEVAAVTMRHIVIKGHTRDEGRFWRFEWSPNNAVNLPDFYLDQVLP